MDDLESAAAADKQHMSAEGQAALQERPSDDLVHGVVPANVFTQDQQLSFGVEKRRGVQAAGAAKDGLGGAQFFGQLAQDFGIELRHGFGAAQAAAAKLADLMEAFPHTPQAEPAENLRAALRCA